MYEHKGRDLWLRWVLANAGGGVLLTPLGWLPVGALGGLIIGLAQWPVLREELSTSYARA